MTIPPLSAIEEIVHNNLDGKKHIPRFYNLLAKCLTESTSDRLNAWRTDMQGILVRRPENGRSKSSKTLS